MRIGIFTETYTPYISGLVTSEVMLKQALEKMGHEVYVVTANLESFHYEYDEKEHVLRIPGVKTGIYDSRLTSIYPIQAINKVKSWNLDVIHSQTEFAIGTFARIFAKQYDIPIVHTYHTMYEDYVHYITKGHFKKSSKKLVEYLTLFYCDKTITELIVPTKKAYDLFKEKYNVTRNIHIIPTGIEVDRFYKENIPLKNVIPLRKKYALTQNDFVGIFVGRLAEEKNVEFLLNMMKELIKDYPFMKLLIVGDGPDKEKYEQRSIDNGTDKNIIFTGKVPWEEIPKYYQVANYFITASKTETQGLTVIEAMAAGLPAICIDDESFHLVVVDDLDGKFFRTQKEAIKKILDLYNNKEEWKRISNQARIKADAFSAQNFASQVLRVYERAIIQNDKNKNFLQRMWKKIRRRVK